MHLFRASIVVNFVKPTALSWCIHTVVIPERCRGRTNWIWRTLDRLPVSRNYNSNSSRPYRPALAHGAEWLWSWLWWSLRAGDGWWSLQYLSLSTWMVTKLCTGYPNTTEITVFLHKQAWEQTLNILRYTFHLLLHDRIVIRGISMRCGIDCWCLSMKCSKWWKWWPRAR